jgi:epoxyqueuosine reductase QueG
MIVKGEPAMLSKEAVKNAGVECGADLVGVAPVERFKDLPGDANPKSIKPDTRSVVVLAFQIPRGTLRGVEEGTAWNTMFQPTVICIDCTYHFCRWLEIQGWEAVPLFNHSRDLRNQGLRVKPDKAAPDVIVDLEYAAHAAGLGQMGAGKLFLTPEFGPRQMFTAVLTDAQIETNPVLNANVCDQCNACVKACPSRALSLEEFTTAKLCEGEARWHKLQVEACQQCRTGTVSLPYTSGIEPFRGYAACSRACVAHLEQSKRLTRAFKNPFRELQEA